jgi:hypothetical protein
MSPRPSNSDTSSSVTAEVEVGETFEVIMDGNRIEAFLSDNVLVFDPRSHHSRYAIRAYAYSLAASGNKTAAKSLLSQVGREG